VTRRRKSNYFALMLLGGVALLIDRCVLSDGAHGPESAVAVSARDSIILSPAPIENQTVPTLCFPRGFDSYEVSDGIRDIFSPLQEPDIGDGVRPGTDKSGQHTDDLLAISSASAMAFSKSHRLLGVILSDSLKIAIVDGTWVQVGQVIDGCRLDSLSGNEAHFVCRDESVDLKVADNATLIPH
jgi:hypothetical protein